MIYTHAQQILTACIPPAAASGSACSMSPQQCDAGGSHSKWYTTTITDTDLSSNVQLLKAKDRKHVFHAKPATRACCPGRFDFLGISCEGAYYKWPMFVSVRMTVNNLASYHDGISGCNCLQQSRTQAQQVIVLLILRHSMSHQRR